jgi:hypothetical protein
MISLTRDEFRNEALKRDNYQCVICGNKNNLSVHHIMNRKLFTLEKQNISNNNVTLCEEHHILAEKTDISCQELRDRAGIKEIILPDHLSPEDTYDCWGNPILPNGTRLRGELFDEPNVQKILEDKLSIFTDKVKYPRTYHVPWSEGAINDDRTLDNMNHFIGKKVIVSVKYDGESANLYQDDFHARSLEPKRDFTKDWIRSFHASVRYDIPKNWRICGENLSYIHSIEYNNLDSLFYGFSMWDDKNICLSWKDTIEWFQLLNIKPVEVLYEGIYDELTIRSLYTPIRPNGDEMEGYVVRLADSFHYRQFKDSMAKMVRHRHIKTDQFWHKNTRMAKIKG